MAFDAAEPDIKKSDFKEYDWYKFYRDAEEALPPNMPGHSRPTKDNQMRMIGQGWNV